MLLLEHYYNLYTSPKQSYQILYILKKYTNKNNIIIDATAGMGGNSLSFCKYYSFVYSIDILDECINYLEHNLIKYDNKLIINYNCLDIINIIQADIIFFDPPWGGNEYKKFKSVELELNNIPMNEIIESYFKYYNVIALKAPNNYIIKPSKNWKIKKHNIFKINIIIFQLIIYYK